MTKYWIEPEVLETLGTSEQRQAAHDALVSGKYTQHTGSMCDPDDMKSACCLMVVAQEIDGIGFLDALSLDYGERV